MNNHKGNITITPREIHELHELLTFKNVCGTKAATMASMVGDPELKSILEQDLNLTKDHIQELQSLVQASQFGH